MKTPRFDHSQPQGTLLTLLEAVAEGAGAAHGPALLVQGHGAVAEARVAVGVVGPVRVGQAVGAQHAGVGQAHLGRSRGARCKASREHPVSAGTTDSHTRFSCDYQQTFSPPLLRDRIFDIIFSRLHWRTQLF